MRLGYPPVHSYTLTLHYHQQWTPLALSPGHSQILSHSSGEKSSPPFPVRNVVLVPGLLPIFLHGCKIKSGSGLGTRLGYPPVHSYTHTLHYHQQWTPTCPLMHPHTTLPSTMDTLLSTHTPTHYTTINNGHPPVHSYTHTLHYHQQWIPSRPLTHPHTTLPSTMDTHLSTHTPTHHTTINNGYTLLSTHTPTHYTAINNGHPPVHSHTHTLHYHQQWTPTCPPTHLHTTLPSTMDTHLSTHTPTHYTAINNGHPPVHSHTHTLHYHQQWTPTCPPTHLHTTLPSTMDTHLSTHTPTHHTTINN